MKNKKYSLKADKEDLEREIISLHRRLAELERFKAGLLSKVGHHLRTPIAIIKESVALTLDEVPGKINKKQRRILNIGMDNIKRLVRTIEELSL